MKSPNKAIKFAPFGRRTLASSRRLWRRYKEQNCEHMKLSNDFSGALRSFAYFMTSGTHNMLEGVDYLDLYGNEPSAIEQVYAIFTNVIELDESGKVVNFKYAQQRATDYLRSYCVHDFEVSPPLEDWETKLYNMPTT